MPDAMQPGPASTARLGQLDGPPTVASLEALPILAGPPLTTRALDEVAAAMGITDESVRRFAEQCRGIRQVRAQAAARLGEPLCTSPSTAHTWPQDGDQCVTCGYGWRADLTPG